MGPVTRRPASLGEGFTLVELVVVICVVALLFGVALDRLLRYQELGERTAMEQNVAAMNVALTMKFAALLASGRGPAIEKEVGANPVDLLARPPENYLGTLYAPDPGSVPPGSWYFDKESGDLVYVPSRRRFLTEPAEAAQGIRFRVALVEPSARGEEGLKELRQALIKARRPYRWSIE
jgi:general secretion pathway protein G